jgi:hypothetical protein
MLKIINISTEVLEEIKKNQFGEGIESSTHIFEEDGSKKIIKIEI